MKMTMHIDEALLDDVIETFGCRSKTEAVSFALKEVLRRRRLREFLKGGLGLTEEELRDSVDPAYDPLSMRVAEDSSPDYRIRPKD